MFGVISECRVTYVPSEKRELQEVMVDRGKILPLKMEEEFNGRIAAIPDLEVILLKLPDKLEKGIQRKSDKLFKSKIRALGRECKAANKRLEETGEDAHAMQLLAGDGGDNKPHTEAMTYRDVSTIIWAARYTNYKPIFKNLADYNSFDHEDFKAFLILEYDRAFRGAKYYTWLQEGGVVTW